MRDGNNGLQYHVKNVMHMSHLRLIMEASNSLISDLQSFQEAENVDTEKYYALQSSLYDATGLVEIDIYVWCVVGCDE